MKQFDLEKLESNLESPSIYTQRWEANDNFFVEMHFLEVKYFIGPFLRTLHTQC